MRPRPQLVVAFVTLFVLLLRPAPAQAGWAAFMAWLSELDPGRSKGVGVEVDLCKCSPLKPPEKLVPRVTFAVLAGDSHETKEKTAFIVPITAGIEYRIGRAGVGVGAGALHIHNLDNGSLTKPLLTSDASFVFLKSGLWSVVGRFELVWLPTGFEAKDFAGGAAKSMELVPSSAILFQYGR